MNRCKNCAEKDDEDSEQTQPCSARRIAQMGQCPLEAGIALHESKLQVVHGITKSPYGIFRSTQ